jgi:hypothetical protein
MRFLHLIHSLLVYASTDGRARGESPAVGDGKIGSAGDAGVMPIVDVIHR